MKITKNTLLKIISKSLDSTEITFESSVLNTGEWDSLTHLVILTDLDEALDGKVSQIRGIANSDSVEKIFNILNENLLIEE